MEIRPEILIEEVNQGEKIVRDLLIKSFSNKPYVALHSVGLSSHKSKPWAEADFVIFTDFGIFCLEVKGGYIKVEKGIWTIGYPDSGKFYTSSEGPFKQSAGTVPPILKKLKQSNNYLSQKFIIYWGVVFPNDEFKIQGAEWELEQVCDVNKINQFEEYLKNLGVFAKKLLLEKNIPFRDEPITKEDIDWAVNTIRRDIVPLGKRSAQSLESNEEIIKLEKSQNSILDKLFFSEKKRLVITGGAGTGKTFLCMNAAREYLAHDKKVLFLCFNKLLANYLNKEFNNLENIQVSTAHQFMMQFIGINKIPERYASNKNYFFETHLPELFEDAIISKSDKPPDYDLLIIDEAQDVLNEQLLSCFFEFLKGGFSSGNWILSLDKGVQKEVYGRMSQTTYEKIIRNGDCFEEPLYRNLRNPKKIAEKANSLFPKLSLPIPTRDFSSFPKKWSYPKDGLLNALEERLNSLISSGAKLHQISLLTTLPQKQSVLNNLNSIGRFKICSLEDASETKVAWSNLYSFKGLENDFVILIEVPEVISEKFKIEYYLSLTRAKTEFHVLFEKNSFLEDL